MNTFKTKALGAFLFFILVYQAFSQPDFNGNSITFENTQTAVITGDDGMMLRTTTGGTSWSADTSGITNSLRNSAFYTTGGGIGSVNVHLVAAENGVILKSTDNGANWDVKFPGTFEDINDIFILSQIATFACGNNGTLFFSTNLGDNWSSVNTGSSVNFNRVIFFQYSTRTQITYKGLLAGDGGVVLTSTGLAGTWSTSTTTTSQDLNTLGFSSSYVIAGGNGGAIMKSSDHGVTWSGATSGTTENIHGIKFIDPSTAIAVGDGGVILRSTNKGDTWSGITSPVTSSLTDVDFGSWNLGIATGVNGATAYTTDGGLSWIEYSADNLHVAVKQDAGNKTVSSGELKLSQNYPNPFNPSTLISYVLPFEAQVSVKIFDMLGKEVKTLVSSRQNSGTYSVSFDASGLSSGIYFYTLKASNGNNEMIKTMRMILTK
jgi:photosystem II stability/assembly factor-like uncharacterized protein